MTQNCEDDKTRQKTSSGVSAGENKAISVNKRKICTYARARANDVTQTLLFPCRKMKQTVQITIVNAITSGHIFAI